ncbi:DUF4230 domain-containing protein [Waterburya agarophytonicola K14]|uniref:DUF4230 domain-containing protein n=1 Tax=Waterburya agarophytonicola KI4 TaxID=2874699 RepID=A0A964BTJ3_9CYAN|nr:DUF4230 domain-containing protein [Waterburya agarophytonicola]MCC0177590.1 DUF4230 domain-containing protein [Waterburya agarophytonicola KI4]
MKTSKADLPFWQQLILLSVGGINLIVLLIIFSLWHTSDRALNFVGNLFKPQPVKLKIDSSTLIVERLQNLQELTTTVQTMEKIVPTSAERKLGDLPIATTRLLYIAQGEIRAGVDLGELTSQDIQIDRQRIEIDLPTAKILDRKIDVDRSRVYDYDRGFLNLGPDVAPQLQTLAQRSTLQEIVKTACDGGILDNANLRAQESISQLLTNLGYERVKVNTTVPASCEFNRDRQTVSEGEQLSPIVVN